MRFQSYVRLIIISVIGAAGLMLLSSGFHLHNAAAQPAATTTPRSTSAPIASAPTTYTVQSGDSFNAIARRFNLTTQELQTLNGITNTSVIRVGQVLIIALNTVTPEPTETPAPTATSTAAPTRTSTTTPTNAPTITPTSAPTNLPPATDLPTATPPVAPIEQPAPPAAVGIPADVIVVGIVMLLALIGLVVGFRTQRY